MGDVAVGPNGVAAFYHQYIENATNPFLVDLNKPIGFDQITASFGSWGAAGGWAVATDGEMIWPLCDNGGVPFVYRADGKRFGTGTARYRRDVYVPRGEPMDLAAWRDPATGKRYVYLAQEQDLDPKFPLRPFGGSLARRTVKPTEGNNIVVLDGENAAELLTVAISHPRAIQVLNGKLYALHLDPPGQWTISSIALNAGLPQGQWQRVCTIQDIPSVSDFKLDSRGNLYVADIDANQVYKLDAQGKIIARFGRATVQQPGHYDDRVFISPAKLAIWTNPQGQERLLIVEQSGPGRVSEWTTDGELLRQWFPSQVHANTTYAADPEHPEHVYLAISRPASGSGLIRFLVNYDTGEWKVDAVWPDICSWDDRFPGGVDYPRIINHNGRKYLTFARVKESRFGCMVYRMDGDNWVPSAALVTVDKPGAPKSAAMQYWWHDANGDGKLRDSEYLSSPAHLPKSIRYWGDNWLDDLSLAMVQISGREVWRLAPASFDEHGNPIFDGTKWTKLLTDSVAQARADGKADVLHGGNEVGDRFNIEWVDICNSPDQVYYLTIYSGPNCPGGIDSTGGFGTQTKLSRYVPDGQGGMRMKWRVGRKAFGLANPGEMYGILHISSPVNGIVGLQDGNGIYHLFSDEGLYVDTVLPDSFRRGRGKSGIYDMSGELFSGYHFLNQQNGKVYIAMGRNATTMFEVQGWTRDNNSINRLTTVDPTVTITAAQVAAAPDFALRTRGGASASKVAQFYPAGGGGPAIDGSMNGWEMVEPLQFALDKDRQVQVRTLYDPENLYLRWQVRLPSKFEAKQAQPLDRIFTHDRMADTLGFYMQSDPAAKPSREEGRSGDLRIVFSIVDDGGKLRPIALGMYPKWPGKANASPLTYASPVGKIAFEHVGEIESARLAYTIDTDGQGFVISAAIPRSSLPMPLIFTGQTRTTVNFEATLTGHAKFWWANTDGSASAVTSDEPGEARLYPGSWTQAQFVALEDALPVRAWLICGPWGGEKLKDAPKNVQDKDRFLTEVFESEKYPPDDGTIDPAAKYTGPQTRDLNGGGRELRWSVMNTPGGGAFIEPWPESQLGYAVTWLYVPQAGSVDCSFTCPRYGSARLYVNDKMVLQHKGRTAAAPDRQALSFQPGWNKILFRGYSLGLRTPLRMGLVVHGTPQQLWTMKLSPTPPR